MESEFEVPVLALKGLCTDGSDAQQQAFELIDNMPRKEAKKLEADDSAVLVANAVCRSCVEWDACTERAEAWIADQSLPLPRPFDNAAVVGDILISRVGMTSIETITPDVPPVMSKTEAVVSVESSHGYDNTKKSGFKTSLEVEMYDFIVNGAATDEFKDSLRGFILDEMNAPPKPKRSNKQGETRKSDQPQPYSAPFSVVFRAAEDRAGYGYNSEQSRRSEMIAAALQGRPNGGLFEGMKDVYSKKQLAERVAASKSEQKMTIVNIREKDYNSYVQKGLCKTDEYAATFVPRVGKTAEKAQAVYLECPVFLECAVTNIFETRDGTVKFAVSPRDLKILLQSVGVKNIAKAVKDPEFPTIREDIWDKFYAFKDVLTPAMFRGLSTDSSSRKSRHEAFATLKADLYSVFKKQPFWKQPPRVGIHGTAKSELPD